MQILDGKIVSEAVKQQVKAKTAALLQEKNIIPHLVAILVGNDGASETYVASKIKNCELVGFKSTLIRFTPEVSENELVQCINNLNIDKHVHGILVQLPLPKHINDAIIINSINPEKDVDGFHPINVGRLVQGLPTFVPATPLGVMMILKHYNIDTVGKHAVVIGRSNIVGRPMSILLSANTNPGNCTVTICHSRTKSLTAICAEADIIVAALGIPKFLKANMVKEGAIVIDVGITRVADETKKLGFALHGDVDFEDVAQKTSYITPVPAGVGLMTIAALLENTLHAAERSAGS
jgi:methylenetetrahydrofolate dehydrogenase (NADP+) / methenyltetrahydrofolate cyclohydrolase